MTPFPWDQAIGFALGVLRLPPESFWRMTPRELAHAIRAVAGVPPSPPTRAEVEALLRRFPDTSRSDRHG